MIPNSHFLCLTIRGIVILVRGFCGAQANRCGAVIPRGDVDQ